MSDRCSSSASTAIQRLWGMAYGVAATSSAVRRSRIATSSPASSLRLRSSGEIRAIRRRKKQPSPQTLEEDIADEGPHHHEARHASQGTDAQETGRAHV